MQDIDSIACSRRIRLRQHLHRMALLRPLILMLIISDNDEIGTIAVFAAQWARQDCAAMSGNRPDQRTQYRGEQS
ncbi:hypothetical protein [Aquitalea sp. ASV15]|uniref:hypothetical protein n=1 Tax=Aquitalea sp. ASV15 TaxID=2795104 RepID=UPI0018EA8615|nr:hypothetical protein [Aquitalea sp. ASV15]